MPVIKFMKDPLVHCSYS